MLTPSAAGLLQSGSRHGVFSDWTRERFNLFKMFIHMKIVFLYIKSFILLLYLLSKWGFCFGLVVFLFFFKKSYFTL